MAPPPGGCVLRSPMCILYSKSNGFCMISLKIIKNLLVFHTFRPWLASGAPLGPWAPSWRPLLDLSGRIFRLGSSLGSSLGASVSFLVCFFCFSTSHGIIFSKFQAFTFYVAVRPYLKPDRPTFPEVVSSCYRAGNWEWVWQTLCRTKDPSP